MSMFKLNRSSLKRHKENGRSILPYFEDSVSGKD